METINIKNFPWLTTILVKKEFIINLTKKLRLSKFTYKSLYSGFNNKNKVKISTFKDNFELSYKSYRRLDIILHACRKLNIPFRELEKNVISYRTKRGRVIIDSPKLPIKVSPIFLMLIAHLMGDGNYLRFKNKRTIYSSYRQYNKNLRLSFLDKVKFVFGDIKFPEDYFSKNESTRIYLPEIPSLLLLNYMKYSTNDFLSHKARIPKYFLRLHRNCLIAILTAFIIDEGNIDSGQICIRLINKNLIEDLYKISKVLDYDCKIGKVSPSGMHNFYILNEGLKKYWKDYILLKRNYPFLTMDYKESAIRNFINRKKKFWRSIGSNKTKNMIIRILKQQSMGAKDLGYFLGISRQGIKYHLDHLRRKRIIKPIKVRIGFKYELIKYVRFKEESKGQSRQQNKSKTKILWLLKNKILSTEDLSKILYIEISAVRRLLLILEKENKIKRGSKVKVDDHHYKLMWTRK